MERYAIIYQEYLERMWKYDITFPHPWIMNQWNINPVLTFHWQYLFLFVDTAGTYKIEEHFFLNFIHIIQDYLTKINLVHNMHSTLQTNSTHQTYMINYINYLIKTSKTTNIIKS